MAADASHAGPRDEHVTPRSGTSDASLHEPQLVSSAQAWTDQAMRAWAEDHRSKVSMTASMDISLRQHVNGQEMSAMS